VTIVSAGRAVFVTILAVGTILVLAFQRVLEWEPGQRASFWILVVTAGAAFWYAWLTYLILRADRTPTLAVSSQGGAQRLSVILAEVRR
jgi:hypothetical protein